MPDDKKLNTQEAAESNVQTEEPTLVTTEVEEDFVDSLMEKYDTESKFATIEGFTKKAVTVISVHGDIPAVHRRLQLPERQ